MPKFPSPRPVLRTHADGSQVLFTKNLGHLRTKLTPGVFNAFIRAFVHVDRLDSLVAFAYLNQKYLEDRPEQQNRNQLTVIAFLMGTMFELSRVLSTLRGNLIKRGLITAKEWESRLPGWDKRWRTDPLCSDFRNKVSFHVDDEWVDKGLDRIAAGKTAEVFRSGPSINRQDGSFQLGQMAILNGTGLSEKELVDLVVRPLRDLQVYWPLTRVFLLALDRVGLTPIVETRNA